jgi:poly [ADP-ribose] polymerase
MTRSELDAKIREKVKGRGKVDTPTYKPPYREIAVLAESMPTGPTGPSIAKAEVHEAAKQQLAKSNPVLIKLVERLVEANRHELHKASGGQMNIDLTTGIISTPIGVITKDSITNARQVLDNLDPFVKKHDFDNKSFISQLNDYLMLVPQQVGHARGWHKTFLTDAAAMSRQTTLLDQLDASAELAEARKKSAIQGAVATSIASTPNLFDAELTLLEDKAEIDRITKFFMSNINSRHESRHLRPIRFYQVKLPKVDAAFEAHGAKLKDIRQLWHGTRMFNVLSILKSGLMLPKTLSTMQIAGAMFGNGCYFSDQSTKSLNYAYGYWDHNSRDKNCFMFLFDVAMGEHYVPKGSYETLPKRGYDSTWAKPGHSGIMNDEMIVYRLDQQRPRFLVEFDEK